MISRFAETGTLQTGTDFTCCRSSVASFRQAAGEAQQKTLARVLSKLGVALVLLTFGYGALHAQEPEQWPQDDDTPQQPAYGAPPAYGSPQAQQQYGYGQPSPQQGYYGGQPGYGQAPGMNAQQLEQLVAPIALYPDSLVAQILAASTYPAQLD